jgi:hypothetical protein
MKEITFDDIQKANETIRTTNIKGKEYAEVNQRLKAFRMVYPKGDIQTKIISLENGVCIMNTDIFDDDGNHLATGTAYEKENSTFINKTSYIENCETSAVGRALGMAGFGIDTSVASAEEVQNAIANQEFKDSLVSDTEAKVIYKALMNKLGSDEEVENYLYCKFNIDNTSKLLKSQYVEIVKEFKEE